MILRQLHELEKTSFAVTRARLVDLRGRGIRLPWRAVNDFLTEIGELSISGTNVEQEFRGGRTRRRP